MDGDKRLILILGDQLSRRIASLRGARKARDVVVMAEVADEAGYVGHHRKKLALVFAAMRAFAAGLREAGWTVDYRALDDPDTPRGLDAVAEDAMARHGADRLVLCEPGEWRLQALFEGLAERLGRPVEIREDDRFLCSRAAFADWAGGRKSLRMEHFYRVMRQRTGLLMADDGTPAGGRWNFDAENRKPPKSGLDCPPPMRFEPDAETARVLDLVEARFPDNFGTLRPFSFAVNAAGAEEAFAHFLEVALPRFGDYQDAMLAGERFLFHAVIAPYLNVGLLDPLDLCRRAEREWREGRAPLNAVEGFVRQILGWREFVRGLYWWRGPDYARENALAHQRALPAFYWSGETDMRCLAACIEQTREEAYAHHIQRLMVTGNFALLAGVDPHAVHEWYLAVYADAYEWVELPNTIGMSQFADGGLLASKPYVSGGNYINRMSDYCGGCGYAVSRRTGEGACPFNALYWHFLDRHRDRLGDNARLGQAYRSWDRMSAARRRETLDSADTFLARLESGDRV